jgi:uncharacterized SAM-binding protein YcdF (DUF218 family)
MHVYRKIILAIGFMFASISIVAIGFLFSLDVSTIKNDRQADIIVSLGGGDGSRVQKAWQLYEEGYSKADKLVVTAVPKNPEKTMNIHPRLKYLVEHKEICYEAACPSETKNTWEEALYIKKYMETYHYKSVIIVTHPLHSGRVKMALDKVAHFKEAGLSYTIVGDREVDFWDNFWKDKELRSYALREVVKRIGYEVKALFFISPAETIL